MKIKYLSLMVLASVFNSCGPSETEIKQHEVKRDSVEQKMEENWEDDMENMMEEVPDSSSGSK